ncbi:MAG TPA: DUF3048 domain-containing protein [Candidatus Saccharimonadales bacterium]
MDQQKPTLRQRVAVLVHKFFRSKRGAYYFLIAFCLLVLSGVGLLAFVNQPVDYTASGFSAHPKKEPEKFYSPLTGLEVKNEAATKQAVTAIILENSPDARPQSGLKNSGVVFEAIAEGGITRFLALYQQEKPQLIGPVRSLRPYYLSWAAGFNPSIAHVGGSFFALKEVRNGKFRDIDQFFNGDAYWRASDRYAPHNVYTSFKRLDALNAAKKYKTSNFTGFLRREIPKKGQPAPVIPGKKATKIQIEVSSPTYNPSYSYDAKTQTYPRSLGGVPHTDREKGRIAPKVVIAIKIVTTLGFEDGYREQMKTIGSGEAYVFQGGKVIKGLWRKKSKQTQMQFIEKSGKPIPLERGQTWITAIPTNRSVTWQ